MKAEQQNFPRRHLVALKCAVRSSVIVDLTEPRTGGTIRVTMLRWLGLGRYSLVLMKDTPDAVVLASGNRPFREPLDDNAS